MLIQGGDWLLQKVPAVPIILLYALQLAPEGSPLIEEI